MIIGLVGKPSSGKSSFFKAATLADILIANYPFATIEKNEGIAFVKVPDPAQEFGKSSNPRDGFVKGRYRFIPFKLIDVAGLVEKAYEGRGHGSKFLDDLNQADALIHVIDISGSVNAEGEPCEPLSYDPLKDVRFLEEELNHWYLRILKNGWERLSKQISLQKQEVWKGIAKQMSGLRVTEEIAEEVMKKLNYEGKPEEWDEEKLKEIARTLRKKTKPMIIAANKIDVEGAEKNYERMKKEFSEYIIIPCSSIAEIALKEAAKKEVIEYIPGENNFKIKKEITTEQEKGLEYIKKNVLEKHGTTGIQEVLNEAVFKLLKYKAIYPAGVGKLEDKNGNVIPDCFLMQEEATALDFAYRLHTDIGKGFVKALNVRTKQPIGKDSVLNDGDIVEIKTTA